MTRSVFAKLILTYLVVVTVTLASSGLFLSYLFRNYIQVTRERQLISRGVALAGLLRDFVTLRKDPARTMELLDTLEQFLDAPLLIVDQRGLVLAASSRNARLRGIVLSQEEVGKVLQGEIITRIFTRGEQPYLSAAVPIFVGGRVAGAIFTFSPLSEMAVVLGNLRRLVLYAFLLGLGLSTILAYALSRNLSRPLHEMSSVAMEMAQGRFGRKVKAAGQDEVGQLARTFNYMAGELENLERMRRDFVANVSHELRTPLTRIRGYVEALRDRVIEGERETEQVLGIVLEETLRLNRLVDDLLELSRLEAGRARGEVEAVDLAAVLVRLRRKMEQQVAKAGLSLGIALPEQLPPVLATPDRVEEVLQNLVDNALRFTPPPGEIRINAGQEGKMVRVAVKDTGVGIPPEELPFIWQRFYKVDRSRSSEGTGLGLPITREIIEMYGGQIQVESKPGQGSTFSFTLPVAEERHSS
ncbi:MAG: cell wall metabolism sensor histidine kinase WalK [Firmicutes bacterium]|nr:cell wall metabolism sensor histidine kinase WalK [Bacillota bacterium]MCL5038650.1 cell wall metabolism sensor histidine kinase WalK [Bacillota bacterium]